MYIPEIAKTECAVLCLYTVYVMYSVYFVFQTLVGYSLLFCVSVIMSTPLGGGHINFAFSAVRRPTWFPNFLGNSSYPIFTKFGMQVNSLYGIAFGDDSSIAN